MTRHAAVWPARLPMQMTPPATSLWMNLVISAWRYPDKTALVFMGKRWTYKALLAACEQLAGHLARLGVKKGDRVVLDMQNCPQLIITHFAILRLDAVVVPVNPMNKAQELEHYITDPDVKVAVTTADLAPELAQASARLHGAGARNPRAYASADLRPHIISIGNDGLLTDKGEYGNSAEEVRALFASDFQSITASEEEGAVAAAEPQRWGDVVRTPAPRRLLVS